MMAKSMIMSRSYMFEKGNQNLALVSNMLAVQNACNDDGALKDLKIKYKLNIHCASGKDRTGIALTDAKNMAISEELGQNDNNLDVLKKLVNGGHTQVLPGINGGTPGAFAVKNDSASALGESEQHKILHKLIQPTAKFNKIKTKRSFGPKLKKPLIILFGLGAVAALAIFAWPAIVASPIVAGIGVALSSQIALGIGVAVGGIILATPLIKLVRTARKKRHAIHKRLEEEYIKQSKPKRENTETIFSESQVENPNRAHDYKLLKKISHIEAAVIFQHLQDQSSLKQYLETLHNNKDLQKKYDEFIKEIKAIKQGMDTTTNTIISKKYNALDDENTIILKKYNALR